MTFSPTNKPPMLVASVLLALLVANSQYALAVDDIDEPAGDIGDTYDEAVDPEMFDVPADGSAAESEPSNGDTEAVVEEDADQIGPVWESYNSNMKSVAQEVTKGLRVEDVVEPPTEYHYAAFGKPDPFVPPMITAREQDAATISSLEVPIVSPLQAHDLSQLAVVGIWQLSSGERKALVMTPSGESAGGQGIIVRNGDPIGKNGGKILAVGETFLTVREFRLAVDGTRQYEDVTMQMGRKASEPSGKIRFVPGSNETQIVPDSDRATVIQSDAVLAPVAGRSRQGEAGNTRPTARLMPTPQNNAGDDAAGQKAAPSAAGIPAVPGVPVVPGAPAVPATDAGTLAPPPNAAVPPPATAPAAANGQAG